MNHKGDCYRIWNPNTKKVSKTRDVVFLNRMFFRTPTKPQHKTQSMTMKTSTVSNKAREGVL